MSPLTNRRTKEREAAEEIEELLDEVEDLLAVIRSRAKELQEETGDDG